MTIAPPPRIQRVPRPLTEAEQAVVDARRAKAQAEIDAKIPGLLAKFGAPQTRTHTKTPKVKTNTSAYV